LIIETLVQRKDRLQPIFPELRLGNAHQSAT
jgi:hypothetical protein